MDILDSYVVSMKNQKNADDMMAEWELALALGGATEKVCHSINVLNGVPVVPLSLATKESKSLLGKLLDKARERVYELHRMIMVLYAPSVLGCTDGALSLKIINRDSGEAIDIVVDHPVAQAAVFVCRWPRAVLAQGSGLALLAAVDGVPTKRGSLVGVLTPFWEDKLSTKMVYERQLAALVYPLEEQEPAYYVKNMKRLRALVANKVHLGGQGGDMEEQTITLALPKPVPSRPQPALGGAIGKSVETSDVAFPPTPLVGMVERVPPSTVQQLAASSTKKGGQGGVPVVVPWRVAVKANPQAGSK